MQQWEAVLQDVSKLSCNNIHFLSSGKLQFVLLQWFSLSVLLSMAFSVLCVLFVCLFHSVMIPTVAHGFNVFSWVSLEFTKIHFDAPLITGRYFLSEYAVYEDSLKSRGMFAFTDPGNFHKRLNLTLKFTLHK